MKINGMIVNKPTAQVRSQFMDEIFDVEYMLGSVYDANLFDLKKRCMYTVFTSDLLTEKS